MHTGVVNDLVVGFDFRIIPGDVAEAIKKQTVRQFHNVGFVNGGYLLATFAARVLEGEASNARRGFLRDNLDALDDAGHDDVLDA